MWARILVGLALLTLPTPVLAQPAVVSVAVQRDLQRFPHDIVPNRLDGAAFGLRLEALVRVWRGLVVAAEWSNTGAIEDVRALTLDVNGRAVTIASTLEHQTRAWLALAGFRHLLTRRVRVAWLGGAAFTNVRRQFRSDAAGLVLVSPSDVSQTAPPIVDRFHTLSGGVSVHVELSDRVQAVSGFRAQPIRLSPDIRGWSARVFAGVGWMF